MGSFVNHFNANEIAFYGLPAGDEASMLHDFLRTLVKITAASLVVGVILGHFGITPDHLIQTVGLSQERMIELAQRGWAWAAPNLFLGALVIVPLWFLIILVRPPRPRND